MGKTEAQYAAANEAQKRYLDRRADDPAFVAARRARIRAYKKRYPEKNQAHLAVHRAITRGDLVRPCRCSQCGIECTPEASHDDYARQLDVEWLCRPCHKRKDRKV